MSPAVAVVALALLVAAPPSESKLGARLYAKLRASPGNVALSPASIRTALAVLRLGAASSTKSELDHVLGDAKPAAAGTTTLYFTPDIKPAPAFLEAAKAQFGATLVPAAPAASAAKLGARATRGAIIENDISFHGAWTTKFPAGATHDAPFFVDAKNAKSVPTMNLDDVTLAAAHSKDVDVVELPYADGGAMLLVVPTSRTGLAAIEAKLDDVDALSAKLQPRPVSVSLPRFTVKWSSSLVPALTALGVKSAWCTANKSDFSAMGSADGPICVDDVLHDATVAVDEQGTTATASTTIHMVAKEGEREGSLDITADHPFLFVIKDAAGTVTFLGRVADPAPDVAATAVPVPHNKD